MTEPLDTTSIELAQKEATDTLTQLTGFAVTNDDDQEFAAELLHQVKANHTLLDEERKRASKPMNEALRVTNGWFKPVLATLLECEKVLKQKIAGYLVSREAANRAALALAASAGSSEEAASALATVTQVAPPAGVSVRKTWKWSVVNEGLVPEEYWSVDAAKIQEDMRESVARDGIPMPIPGVRFFQEESLAARRI